MKPVYVVQMRLKRDSAVNGSYFHWSDVVSTEDRDRATEVEEKYKKLGYTTRIFEKVHAGKRFNFTMSS